MEQIIKQLLTALDRVSSSPLALFGYLLVIIAWVLIAFRIKRSKELLQNIEKLPNDDRLKAFQSEIGEVPIKESFTPEQYIKLRIHKYYFAAFMILCLLIAYLLTLSAFKSMSRTETGLANEWKNYRLISHADYAAETKEERAFYCNTWGCGNDGTWDRDIVDGKYYAENMNDQSAITYVFIDKTDLIGEWDRIVGVGPFNPYSVDISIINGEPIDSWVSGAGLLFRYSPGRYYVYIISTTGEVSFLHFSDGRFSTIFKKVIEGFSVSTEYKLGIAGDKESIFLYLNDELLQVISNSKNIFGLGGIVMIGKGRYRFDNFRIYEAINE